MPQQLSDRVIDVLSMDIKAPEKEIFEASTEAVRERDAETDAEKVAGLVSEYRADGLAVLGVEETLAALYNGQADKLFIQAAAENISYDAGRVEKVIDMYNPEARSGLDLAQARVVADELIRLAQSTSAGTTFIENPELLSEFGGAGATLRYKI